MTEPLQRRRVLFVEDEPALRFSYERYFRNRYELAFAATGAEALAQLRAMRPDVLVLDMRLPDTDGVDLLRRLREERPQIPTFITTAYVCMEPRLRVLDLPFEGYLVKPFELRDLGDRIDALA
ncbi:MAG: response regulator [Gemmatimonadetes bacterium]|nr:response regulator [Gemmatimonadota bacterium]